MSLECTLAFSFYIICKPATAAFFFLLWLQSVVHFDFFRLLVTALLLVSHYEFMMMIWASAPVFLVFGLLWEVCMV